MTFFIIVILFFFQTRITERVISLYKNDINIDYDFLEIDIFGETNIENLLIKDHHNDTIIYAKEIRILKTPFFELLENKINPNQINLIGLKIKVVKYLNESSNSFSSLINRLKKKNNNFLFFSNLLRVENGFFTFIDQNNKSKKPFVIDDFSFVSDNLNFSEKSTNFSIDSLSISSNKKLLNIDYFKSDFDYQSNKISFKNFYYKHKLFQFGGEFEIINNDLSFNNIINSSIINIDITESKINPSLFNFKDFKFNTNQFLNIILKGNGPINNFKLNKLLVKHPLINLNAISTISLDNRFNLNKADLVINDLQFKNHLIDLQNNSNLNKLISPLINSSLNGKIELNHESLGIEAELKTDIGGLNVISLIPIDFFKENNFKDEFDFNIGFDNLNLSSYFNLKESLKLYGNVNFNFFRNENDVLDLKWRSNNLIISNRLNNYPNISIDGYYNNKRIFNTLNVKNKILEMKSDFKFDFSDNLSKYSAAINVLNFNINSLALNLGGGKAVLSGVSLINLKGKDFNSIVGSVHLSSLKLINNIKETNFNPVLINQNKNLNKTEFLIDNNDLINVKIEGDYRNGEIFSLIQNAFLKAYEIKPLKTISDKQSLSFEIKVYNKLLEALYPNISFGSNLNLIGNLSSKNIKSKIEIQFPLFTYKNFVFKDLNYELSLDGDNKKSLLKINQFNHPLYRITDLILSTLSIKEGVLFESIFKGDNGNDLYDLNFLKINDKKSNSSLVFRESKIKYKNSFWNFDSSSDKKIIQFDNKLDKVRINGIKLRNNDRFIDFSALLNNKSISELNLNFKNINLKEFLPLYTNFNFSGSTDLSLYYKISPNKTLLNFNSNVRYLKINNTDYGILNLSLTNNFDDNKYSLNFNLVDPEKNKIIQGFGEIYGERMGFYEVDFNLKDLDLSFLSNLSKKSINEIKGLASGNFKLIKKDGKITHKGSLNLINGKLTIPYLNTKYTIDNSSVDLNENNIFFNNINFSDLEENRGGLLNGKIYHNNLKDWAVDFNIISKSLLVLDKVFKESEVFYGKGYFTGDVSLKGLTKNVEINVDGKTEKGTSIKIPWSDNYEIKDDNFINFLDKNKDQKVDSKPFNSYNDLEGVDIKFDLDFNELAEIEIVLDKDSGSSLTGRGEGNLVMEINTKGKFNMWGDFSASEGLYNFKNLGLIDKKLILSPGGTIVWDGNPLDAKMDFDAIYQVPGGANPAILLDNPSFNKKIPTQVKIHLEGKLLKPDDPVFEINFPNTSGTAESEINYRLSDPQIRQLQSLSLLSQGIFINEVGVSMQGITNNLYQKASDVFTNLLGDNNEKLKIGVNYLQGDKSALLDVATEDRLGFTLSTKISEKILLNGKIGVPIGGLEQTLIVGNVQMDFLLNEEGSLKAKVFSKENEFRYIGDELGYTQGLGISYDVDFNTFKSLINKIKNKEFDLNKINFMNKN